MPFRRKRISSTARGTEDRLGVSIRKSNFGCAGIAGNGRSRPGSTVPGRPPGTWAITSCATNNRVQTTTTTAKAQRQYPDRDASVTQCPAHRKCHDRGRRTHSGWNWQNSAATQNNKLTPPLEYSTNNLWDLICAATKDRSGAHAATGIADITAAPLPTQMNARKPQGRQPAGPIPPPYRSEKQQRICHRYFWFTLPRAYEWPGLPLWLHRKRPDPAYYLARTALYGAIFDPAGRHNGAAQNAMASSRRPAHPSGADAD